jgi:tRNA pseudouridine38-40 synthase
MKSRYRAIVEYDGTDFKGFQFQAQGERTVQETIENAIYKISNQVVRIIGAGRTDAGVHARGQVVAFDVDWRHDIQALYRAMNANLPEDVKVRKIEQAEENFHPRFDARRRIYEYTIYNQKEPSPVSRRMTWHLPNRLDEKAMNQASQLLIGEHDFATFGRPTVGDNTIRCVYAASWLARAGFITFTIEANAFLNRMVRSLVGSLCQVGEEKWSVEYFFEIFSQAKRALAAPTAPPQGLCLVSVSYDND